MLLQNKIFWAINILEFLILLLPKFVLCDKCYSNGNMGICIEKSKCNNSITDNVKCPGNNNFVCCVLETTANKNNIIRNTRHRVINYLNVKKNKRYCKKCLNLKGKKGLDCYNRCPAFKILSSLNILSSEETVDDIINNKKSISRFGDGEFDLIFGKGIGFQKFDKNMSKRLTDILQSNKEGLIIAIPITLKTVKTNNNFWKNFISKYQYKLINLFNFNKIYGNAGISRFYNFNSNGNFVLNYINKLKLIWDKKDVVIIEGEKSRFGFNNDLLNNTKTIQRILCPVKNAYNVYEKIYNEALKINKDKLILIALGPTATILAYDLHNVGYQAIDIGHADISYEWFLRNATHKIKIDNKYVNEACGGGTNIEDITDKSYYDQILVKILNE
ncbi:DUF1792-domain-containing protein [Neocallimastix lanati (nom. inval.)]|nr:DUF1792-domain-containing protein [Neocallimastix sp. JGI-2020a]